MDLTLDYNIELYPLSKGASFSLALATSLSRGPPPTTEGGDEDKDKDQDVNVWRPDGQGKGGLDDDYEYVMYGKVRVASLEVRARS